MIDINNFVAGYAGKYRGQVSNPCMTARQAIQLADQIAALQAAFEKARTDANTSQHQVEALQARVQELESKVPKWVPVSERMPEPSHDCTLLGNDKNRVLPRVYRRFSYLLRTPNDEFRL